MTRCKRKETSGRISSREQLVEESLSAIKSLDEDVKRAKNSDVKEMIKYHVERTDEIETRRAKARDLALQVLGISTTGLVLLVNQSTKMDVWVFWALAFTLGFEILASVLVLFVHEFQAAFRYPFLDLQKHGNKWKWFYRGNKAILRLNASPFATQGQKKEALEPYLEGLSEFVRNYADEDLDRELADNLEQLYLLIVHNYYKNQFYLQLTRIWKWVGTVPLVVISIIIICRIVYAGMQRAIG